MAGLSSRQRHAITVEIQTIAMACRLHIDSPEDIEDNAHKCITKVINLTKVLLCEILPNEFIMGLKNSSERAYYRNLIMPDTVKGKGRSCVP